MKIGHKTQHSTKKGGFRFQYFHPQNWAPLAGTLTKICWLPSARSSPMASWASLAGIRGLFFQKPGKNVFEVRMQNEINLLQILRETNLCKP